MSSDPFNYPMPNRKDLMSLQTINPNKDFAKTTTKSLITGRLESNNLNTSDITGNFSCIKYQVLLLSYTVLAR